MEYGTMNTECVEEDLRALIAEALDRDTARLRPDEPLIEALELDSLHALQLLVAVEERFDIYFPDHCLSQLNTLRRLTDGVHQQLTENLS